MSQDDFDSSIITHQDEPAAVMHATAARRGRKPKVRHDAEQVVIDGDVNFQLALANADPKFEYAWLTQDDLSRLGYRGYEVVKWEPGGVRPKFHFGEQRRGEAICLRELTLARIPKSRISAFREAEARPHREAMSFIRGAYQTEERGAVDVNVMP